MISIDDFKLSCRNEPHDIVVQKYIIEGTSFFFNKISEEKTEFDFKKEIAKTLDVHIRDIVIVGSGKLGFSLKPDIYSPSVYEYKEFDYDFKQDSTKEKSDLDIAVISSSLFDKEMRNLFNHTNFYNEESVKIWGNRNNLAKYFLKGRLATRFFPIDFKLTQEIREIQSEYQMQYGRKVNIEIYKSWFFFETYHQQNIQNIHLNLIAY
ncbi:hypothetical protein AB2S32_02995 [Elizabethkingia anophelis]|uniref:hypothetical protein n=1 Tax=Elizabethkingia anophelis TaxID=1117645 RepID=UPI003461F48E|nr:hypothetical protein [Elizabethkingia anophelis]